MRGRRASRATARRGALGAVLMSAAFSLWAQADLIPGEELTLTLPALASGQVDIIDNIQFSVAAGTDELRIDLTGSGGRNLDLLLSREPLPDGLSVSGLIAAADYYSASLGSDEFVTLQQSANPPLGTAGQIWHVTVLAYAGSAEQAGLSATIRDDGPRPVEFIFDFDNPLGSSQCDTAPWNDPTPFTATGRNRATTLGEARRNAAIEAGRLLSEQLFSPVPVRIRACWQNLGESEGGGAVLAFANTRFFADDTPGLNNSRFHVQPVFIRRAGTLACNIFNDIDCRGHDLFITFNADIDTDEVFGARRWYYGYDRAPAGNTDVDFISITIHEVTHGLGFTSFTGQSGSLARNDFGQAVGDAYSARLLDNRNGERIPFVDSGVTDAQRAAAITSGTGLQWSGAESAVSNANTLANQGDGYPQMFAPNPYDGGSSVAHLNNGYCAVMRPNNTAACEGSPFRGLGIERAMLHELGWAPAPNNPPFLGLWFDRARDGHGFEFQLGGVDPMLGPIYVLTFYSYETLGSQPEWFQAAGPIDTGTFSGLRGDLTAGVSLPQFNYQGDRSPPQQADPDAFGQVAFSFNDPAGSVACNDGVDRSDALLLASFQWATANLKGEWCVEPIPGTEQRPDIDFGGLWYAGEADTGWGFSLENIRRDDGSVDLFVLLYVYAADGTPVWYFAFESDVDLGVGVDMDLFQRRGFPRIRDSGALTDTQAGSFSIRLDDPGAGLDGSNSVSVAVTYQGAEGGDWVRSDVPVIRLSQPR